MLQDEYGVDLDRVTWVSAEEEHVPRYQADAPANVSYELGCDLAAMLASGDLAAGIGVSAAGQEHLAPLIRGRAGRRGELLPAHRRSADQPRHRGAR